MGYITLQNKNIKLPEPDARCVDYILKKQPNIKCLFRMLQVVEIVHYAMSNIDSIDTNLKEKLEKAMAKLQRIYMDVLTGKPEAAIAASDIYRFLLEEVGIDPFGKHRFVFLTKEESDELEKLIEKLINDLIRGV